MSSFCPRSDHGSELANFGGVVKKTASVIWYSESIPTPPQPHFENSLKPASLITTTAILIAIRGFLLEGVYPSVTKFPARKEKKIDPTHPHPPQGIVILSFPAACSPPSTTVLVATPQNPHEQLDISVWPRNEQLLFVFNIFYFYHACDRAPTNIIQQECNEITDVISLANPSDIL